MGPPTIAAANKVLKIKVKAKEKVMIFVLLIKSNPKGEGYMVSQALCSGFFMRAKKEKGLLFSPDILEITED